MKNLKRALSLVLSTAMLAGMMMVGTGAAFDDVTAEHNEEAIAVVSAAGIMGANEEFNPDAKITRNEMAVVMVNMLGLDTKDFAGASQFTDVPEWAADYVDACYANGIVSGVSATQYNGGANVTLTEAALMLQKALGYFQFSVDFGDDWALETIKNASKIDLLDGVDAKASANVTRNEVAQLVLNALESVVVEGEQSGNTTNITAGDVQIEVVGKTTYTKQENKITYNPDNDDEDNYEYLIEKLFEDDFIKSADRTKLGQPANKWEDMTQKQADRKIISVAKEPKYTVTLEEAYVSGHDVYTDLIDEDATKDDLGYAAANQYINGVENWDGFTATAGKWFAIGDVVEFYFNSDNKITDVVTLRYDFSEITKIDTKTLTKAQKEDGVTAKVTIEGETAVLDTKFAGFDYAKGDKILYIMNAEGNEVLASELAESIEGKVSYVKGNKAKIDGTYYLDSYGASVAETGTFYLGKAGEIVAADTTVASDDYLMIYALDIKEDGKNADGLVAPVVKAYTVLADGTKKVFEVDVDVVAREAQAQAEGELLNNYYYADTEVEVATGVIAYSVNSDGKLVYEEEKHDISDNALSAIISKTNARGTDSNTEFIFTYRDGSAQKVKLATGYKNVNTNNAPYWTVTDTKGTESATDDVILYVFVAGPNGTVTSDVNLAVITDATPAVGENADEEPTYTYAVVIDGVESELTFKEDMRFSDGQVIAYLFEGAWAMEDESVDLTPAEVAAATADYVTVGETQYNLTGEEIVYTVIMEYEDETRAELLSVTVAEGGDIEAGDVVTYTVDGEDIDTIFVLEIVE